MQQVRLAAPAFLFLGLLLAGCSKDDSSQPTGPGSDVTLGGAVTSQSNALRPSVGSNHDRTRLEASLVGSPANPSASGKARWEERSDRTRFKTEVEDASSTGLHEVRVNGLFVTTVDVRGGRGEIELDSRNGAKIPPMQAGDVVAVFNLEGDLVASGVLQ